MSNKFITADFIPHHQFHKGIWFLSVKRPFWYYFMKKNSRHSIHNHSFLKSVDTPLKELVAFLHSKGIPTTPSCAGHHKRKQDFEKIYEALVLDEEDIRNGGLQLKEIESGKVYIYRDKKYHLPWSKSIFSQKIMKHQARGIIGIRFRQKIRNHILHLRLPGVEIQRKGSLVFIRTTGSVRNIHNLWKRITHEVKRIFKSGIERDHSVPLIEKPYL